MGRGSPGLGLRSRGWLDKKNDRLSRSHLDFLTCEAQCPRPPPLTSPSQENPVAEDCLCPGWSVLPERGSRGVLEAVAAAH